MTSSTVVKVENVKKTFRLPNDNTNSLKRTVTNYFKGVKGYREQRVLKNISFEVEKGDFFGIVGRNGSGKSTLLKIISQIYQPDFGSVEVNGQLVSFIELGVGFNPELSGKENVYLNGALLGFSTKEVDAMYNDIVDFAELHEFMNQKLKNYSSGMQVRLAFSVAIRVKSDILVLDEVLAVGDEAFQRKCNDYFLKSKEEEKTIILVTHSMDAIRKYCNKALLIDMGEIKVIGTPEIVADQYSLDNVLESGPSSDIEGELNKETKESNNESKAIVKNLTVKLLSNQILNNETKKVIFEITYEVLDNEETYLAFSFTDIDRNIWIYNDNSYDFMTSGKGLKKFVYECSFDKLNACKMKLVTSIRNKNDEPVFFSDKNNSPIIFISTHEDQSKSERIASSGLIERNGKWIVNPDNVYNKE